MGRSQ
jgi:peroxiredoxin